ncbi:MAG: HAD-IA family hydrolase [Verrucomicrobia bacterium]|jgi:beta-phosphoglucomutase family hydrolase|nr:HAD-IA family hydrolase [Verrucomicrobiota bacterium]
MENWAAIFDWDGVIIDSSRQHEQSWEQLAREEKCALPPNFFKRSFGMKNERIIPRLLGWTSDPARVRRLSDRKEEIYRELILHKRIETLPGVVEWLNTLCDAEIPCAIGSSTPRENIECVIDALKLRGFFRAVVAGQDVTHGKPNPEVFLLGARQLGLPPARCVVFEDAHVGLEAARRRHESRGRGHDASGGIIERRRPRGAADG